MADPPVRLHAGSDMPLSPEEHQSKHESTTETGSEAAHPVQQDTDNISVMEQPAMLAAGRTALDPSDDALEESDGISDNAGGEDDGSDSGIDDPTWDAASETASETLSPEEILAQERRREEIRKGKAKEIISSSPGSPSQSQHRENTPDPPSDPWLAQSGTGQPLEVAISQLALEEPLADLLERIEDGGAGQRAVPGPSAEGGPVLSEPDAGETAEAQGYVFVPWEKDPDRPLQKLPIRFRDCLGRTFLFPWEKARTWKGTKHLINEALGHVDDIGSQVKGGHYDLIAWDVWESEKFASINPKLTSYVHPPQESQHSEDSSSSSPAAEAPPAGFVGSVVNGNGSPTKDMGVKTRNAVILPELWEFVVEPGMLISMVLWPWKKKKKVFHPSSSGSGWSSFTPSGQMQTVTVGTGRGRGGGMMPPNQPLGRGRGAPPPPPHGAHGAHPGAVPPHLLHNPPPAGVPPGAGRGTWQAPPPPRGITIVHAKTIIPKTKKKQER